VLVGSIPNIFETIGPSATARTLPRRSKNSTRKLYLSIFALISTTLHALVLRTCRWWSNSEKKGKGGNEKEKHEKRAGRGKSRDESRGRENCKMKKGERGEREERERERERERGRGRVKEKERMLCGALSGV
jgi:hypothetical protein